MKIINAVKFVAQALPVFSWILIAMYTLLWASIVVLAHVV